MIYNAIDTFYLTEEELQNSPSRQHDIDESTEITLRIYGCDLIQESGILLRLPQAVMATSQVLFHRFYCKKSFARFNVKRVAAGCVWLASKLEECPRKARQVLLVFHRMECRRENLPIEHLDTFSKRYTDLRADLTRTERHILKEMGFICHVEHPHKFISNYLATLETPPELRQEAWNLANDSLRTTLCVRFKSEVVACGVIYAAARRFQVPLPENPPWWEAFDAKKEGIDEVCRVLAHLYSLPKAPYIPVCNDGGSFATSNRSQDLSNQSVPKLAYIKRSVVATSQDGAQVGATTTADTTGKEPSSPVNPEVGKDIKAKGALDKLKDSRKSDDESKPSLSCGELREEPDPKSMSDNRLEAGVERSKKRDRDRDRDREDERTRSRDNDRGRDSDREREKLRERVGHRSSKGRDADSAGRSGKPKHHSSRDRDYHGSSYSSREKDRRKHHSYT